MNIFGIGLPEMGLIMVVALLVFGPKKLPEIGRSLGKTLRSFQDASKEFENEFKREAQQIEESVRQTGKLNDGADSDFVKMNAKLESNQDSTVLNAQESENSTASDRG